MLREQKLACLAAVVSEEAQDVMAVRGVAERGLPLSVENNIAL